MRFFTEITSGFWEKLYFLLMMHSDFSDALAKHAVAREFGLNHHKFLRSWLECLAVFRNCCVRHSRLLNRVFPVKPMMPEQSLLLRPSILASTTKYPCPPF